MIDVNDGLLACVGKAVTPSTAGRNPFLSLQDIEWSNGGSSLIVVHRMYTSAL
jgi:hypothetical protein